MSAQPAGSAPNAGEGARATRFSRGRRLLRHGDFQRVYQQGRRQFAPHMTLFYVARVSEPCGPHVGLTVGRVLGGAVERNRIKRRLREAVRANLGTLTTAVDVVINPKKSALNLDFAALRDEVGRALQAVQEKVQASAADQ